MKLPILTAAGFLTLATASHFDYHGYKVFRLNTGLETGSDFLEDCLSGFDYNIYDSDSLGNLSVAIAPDNVTAFQALGLHASVLHDNLGADIDAESESGTGIGKMSVQSSILKLNDCLARRDDWFKEWFTSYHEFYEHQDFWDALLGCFSRNSENIKIGETYQSRDIRAFHLYNRTQQEKNPPSVFFHANSYGREWISTAVAEYFMFRLINDCLNGDEEAIRMLKEHDFYIVPVVNPDGMAHTQQVDRNWQSNLQERAGQDCTGTNVNRNWPMHWYHHRSHDGSDWPCTEAFRGESPGDTQEVRALMKLTEDVLGISESRLPTGRKIKLFIDWQGRGQHVLWPYHTIRATYEFQRRHEDMGGRLGTFLDGICTHDDCTRWTASLASDVEDLSGTGLDYMSKYSDPIFDKLEWAFAIRVRSRGGKYVIPRTEIVPSGEEQYKAVKWLLEPGRLDA